MFDQVPGFAWKIRGSGTYLFSDAESLHSYLSGSIATQVKSGAFGLQNVEIRHQEVQEGPTRITRGPLQAAEEIEEARPPSR